MGNRIAMPSPVKIKETYYLRIRIPADLVKKLKGQSIFLKVNGSPRKILLNKTVKVSLRTSDITIAKRHFAETYADLTGYFNTVRNGPKELSHKQSLALAGLVANAFIGAFDENPAHPAMWRNVLEVNKLARQGKLNPLRIIPNGADMIMIKKDLEERLGAIADAVLQNQSIITTPESRFRFILHLAQAMDDMATINLRKAKGDYSDTGLMQKYPDLAPTRPENTASDNNRAVASLTFNEVIDNQEKQRNAGRDSKPIRPNTIRKYRLACHEFSEFRKSDIISTVTPLEAQSWRDDMLKKQIIGNRTIGDRMNSVTTVISWARSQTLGEAFKNGNPFTLIEKPAYQTAPSDERAYTMDEARAVLLAARKEKRNDERWLPWLSAYSGARINELAQLTPSSFFQVDGLWFYRLTTIGGRTLKTASSERRIPVHPDLIKEGLIEFIKQSKNKPDSFLFSRRSQANISEWIRNTVGIKRQHLAPNHGWRHLFEDLCMDGGLLDSARLYLTGRSSGRSDQQYGGSQARLPSLYAEMSKIRSFLPIANKRYTALKAVLKREN